MLTFYSGMPYKHFTKQQVHTFCEGLREARQAYGFKYYANKIEEEMHNLTLDIPLNDLPKGILFNGPPRVGKTHICKILISELGLYLMYPMIAAGDFNQPNVGESEKMITYIADRSDVLPWELCVLFVDEIDGLAPNRKGQNVSDHHINMLSIFLSVMDGNKKKKNMLIIGTSNRLAEMDDAFKQRFDIKLFIGLPNAESRKGWLDSMVKKYLDQKKYDQYRTELTRLRDNFSELFVKNTLNFTADALKKSLQEIISKSVNVLEEGRPVDFAQIIMGSLARICENDGIFISSYVPPMLVSYSTQCEKRLQDLQKQTVRQLTALDRDNRITRKVFVDLSPDIPHEERIQLEGQENARVAITDKESIRLFQEVETQILEYNYGGGEKEAAQRTFQKLLEREALFFREIDYLELELL